jgi:dTDP-4-amino-4,6-dideoxygalactose transaminase
MTEEKIWLSPPHLTGKEIDYIKEAFDKNWVSPYGSNVESFEKKLEAYFDVPDVALVNSGTAAIHLSLLVSGIGRGDEVIVPTLNFAGCVNPILYQNATPLFIDSEKDTWNMDPGIVEDVIKKGIEKGNKPKAIIAVHLFGTPCKIEEIVSLGEKYGIPVIEDAADAIGSKYNNKKAGTFGQLGIFSFNGNKTVTTSGGGALISMDTTLIEHAKHLSNQARKLTPHYIHDTVGYNYMMSNILAGIGTAQMDVVDERIAARRRIYDTYKQELEYIDGIDFPNEMEGSFANRWLSTMLVKESKDGKLNRDYLYRALAHLNIETRPVWNPMHLQPAFEKYPYFGSEVAENLFKTGICLPSGSGMTDVQLSYVIDSIKSILLK